MSARKKSSARRPTRTVRKAAPKPSRKRKVAPARGAAPKRTAGPQPVRTGSGPSPLEVAKRVLELLRAGKAEEVESRWLSPAITSTEGVGASVCWSGKKAVLDKYRAWEADHDVLDLVLDGPWVGATGFALKYRIDVVQKSTGQRSQMEEIAVYTVRNGKIVAEEFHYAVPG